jgi:hypothetical protein
MYLPFCAIWVGLTSPSPEVRQIYPSEPAKRALAWVKLLAVRATSVRAIKRALEAETSPVRSISLAISSARALDIKASVLRACTRSAASRGKEVINLTWDSMSCWKRIPVGACSNSTRRAFDI